MSLSDAAQQRNIGAMNDVSGTWHHGLMARWWAEFNVAEPATIAYFRGAIQKYGEPALDVGCGTGRILIPLLANGFDVDGSDISADMIALARQQATKAGFSPRLTVSPMHGLEVDRSYRTIYMCGSLGIGGRRDHDREALRRAYQGLAPGGTLLITDHELPYGGSEQAWTLWLPGHRTGLPREWPAEGERRTTADGDEIELIFRNVELDPLEQRRVLDMRARLWHDGKVVKEEAHTLKECWYFAQEIVLMLRDAGFRDVAIEGNYNGLPATGDDGMVIFVARK